MSLNTYGHLFRVTTWGESHGPALGATIDGCPPACRSPRPTSKHGSTKESPAKTSSPPKGARLTRWKSSPAPSKG